MILVYYIIILLFLKNMQQSLFGCFILYYSLCGVNFEQIYMKLLCTVNHYVLYAIDMPYKFLTMMIFFSIFYKWNSRILCLNYYLLKMLDRLLIFLVNFLHLQIVLILPLLPLQNNTWL